MKIQCFTLRRVTQKKGVFAISVYCHILIKRFSHSLSLISSDDRKYNDIGSGSGTQRSMLD